MNIYKTGPSGDARLDAVARSSLAGWLGVALIAFSCTNTAPAVAAEIAASVEVEADTPYPPLHTGDFELVEDPIAPISLSHQAGIGAVGGAANARVGLGWMQIDAFSDAIAGTAIEDRQGSVTTTAAGYFIDEATITPEDPALLNRPGTATFAVHVGGVVAKGDGPTGVEAGATFPFQSTSTGNPPISFSLRNYDWGVFGDAVDETLEFTQEIVFGQPFPIRVNMYARARATLDVFNDVTATFADSDFSNTFQWMGTLGVVDELEQEVSDYTLSSESGADYRNAIEAPPVPEPGPPGDYNGDGAVDAADYAVWRKTDGTPQAYDEWRASFGQTTGTASAAAANLSVIPEPAALVLLVLATPLATCLRRSRRKSR